MNSLIHPPKKARYQIQIQRSRREAETIATILRRHGGVCVDFGATRIYELPSEAAYDAALSAVRSVHGWTSVEPAPVLSGGTRFMPPQSGIRRRAR